MVWTTLKLGNYNLKMTSLNPIEKEYPSCDKDGKLLKKISGKFEKGYFINEDTGEKHDTAFKLINNKPYAKLSKTKEISVFKEVDLNEIELSIKTMETRHEIGELPLEAYRKQLTDLERRKNKIENTISGLLLRLRGEAR